MHPYKIDTIGSLLANHEPSRTPRFSVAFLRRRIAAAFLCAGTFPSKRSLRRDDSSLPSKRSLRRDDPSFLSTPPPPPTGRLSELLAEPSESGSDDPDVEIEELTNVAKRLQCGDREAAGDVRRLAKDDPSARETLATLGVIPPLVAMIVPAADPKILVAALYGLLNLTIRNNLNKAEIVKAGAVHSIMDLVEFGCSNEVTDAIVANFLGLTALDANKAIVGASGAIAFLLKSFKERLEAREDAVRALYNLSMETCNAAALVKAGAVETMAEAIGEAEVGERAVGVVANVVGASAEGRSAASAWMGAVAEALGWAECQESAAYVMMVMAHDGYGERIKEEKGAMTALLEVALVGSPLAQRRAARALECLRVAGKGKEAVVVGELSAPQCGGDGRSEEGWWWEGKERRAVKELVKQSLQCNMRRMARRANLAAGAGEGSDRLMSISGSGNSTVSLPF